MKKIVGMNMPSFAASAEGILRAKGSYQLNPIGTILQQPYLDLIRPINQLVQPDFLETYRGLEFTLAYKDLVVGRGLCTPDFENINHYIVKELLSDVELKEQNADPMYSAGMDEVTFTFSTEGDEESFLVKERMVQGFSLNCDTFVFDHFEVALITCEKGGSLYCVKRLNGTPMSATAVQDLLPFIQTVIFEEKSNVKTQKTILLPNLQTDVMESDLSFMLEAMLSTDGKLTEIKSTMQIALSAVGYSAKQVIAMGAEFESCFIKKELEKVVFDGQFIISAVADELPLSVVLVDPVVNPDWYFSINQVF